MSSPDTFDRQFRRTARGLRRRPNPANWDRIEQRLDGRARRGRMLGIRPWMIAAVVLLVAGYAVLLALPEPKVPDPLAQRAQSVEDPLLGSTALPTNRIAPYRPLQDGRTDGYLISHSESAARLTVAAKYRL
ncbi:hypothetical protein LEM8419_03134 [Neolewinella maritima]|uniref:Uncharacterized protein n=1 Tax=Neolewinella maritima TaxID=1383882 RepID=A0ABM9B5K9_9BACT|nr:hypothetical protein [Neolewinella maritima]CAH1002217.1 hypothetical protein LEM8419_03134 [Neolewinella maritima]